MLVIKTGHMFSIVDVSTATYEGPGHSHFL